VRRSPVLASLALSAGLAAGCAKGRPPARPTILPFAPAWKTLVGEFVRPPLAADGKRIFVSTSDGVVRGLDPATGAVSWKAEGAPGTLAAADGVVLVRDESGTVRSLHPRTGVVRWTAETGVAGTLPPVIDGDRALVAGEGLACLETATGRVVWTDRSGPGITAPPLRVGGRILTGEKDGALRSRDPATGAPTWSVPTGRAIEAAPVVDEARGKAYLGTTDRRIIEVDLRDGGTGWRWKVGADIVDQGILLPRAVAFAAYDAVLYALRPGGNLDWRAPLPSRPLSGPVRVGEYLVVACLENEMVAIAPDTGRRLGIFRTAAEIRTPPLVLGGRVVVGLRDRSVVAYVPAGVEPVPPAPPAEPPAGEPPAAPPPPVSREGPASPPASRG
jgi:outer membrane protein assembly factor BamB